MRRLRHQRLARELRHRRRGRHDDDDDQPRGALRARRSATCLAPCTYSYDTSATPTLTGASVVDDSSDTQWTIQVDGTGFLTPSSRNTIFIGGAPCAPLGATDTSTRITCTSTPPLSGMQAVSLVNEWGAALGDPTLPHIQGVDLTLGMIQPMNVSLAGGAELVLYGAGFHATESRVNVCDQECGVIMVGPLQLRCTVPSLFLHASGVHTLNLTNATEATYDLGSRAAAAAADGHRRRGDAERRHDARRARSSR